MVVQTYARISGGLVVELLTTDADIASLFNPALTWVPANPAGVAVGWSYAAGAFSPPAPETLGQAQAAQIALLSAACRAEIVAGFTSSALGTAHFYPSKFTDQQNLTASIVASLMPGVAPGWVTPFWCADSTGAWAYTSHTATQIQQVGQDGKAAILAALVKNGTLADQVNAATTIAAVQAVTW